MADRLLQTRILVHDATGEVYKGQSIPANATFIHSDKIVIDDTDELWCSMTGTGSLDVICSYLQQDD